MALYVDFGNPVSANLVPYHRVRKQQFLGVLQEGVFNPGDYKVAQRAAGATQTVDVAGGDAWVQTDSDTPDGLAHVQHDTTDNFAVTASNATNPRIDRVVLQYNDTTLPAGVGGDAPTIRVIAGTPTAGAQAATPTGAGYLAGAAAVPNDALLLADVLVPATSTSVTNANIVDRRKWARGAEWITTRQGAGLNIAVTTTTKALIDAVNFQPRIECSGVPMKVRLEGSVFTSAAIFDSIFDLFVDSALIGTGRERTIPNPAATSKTYGFNWEWQFTPTAGTHFIGPTLHVSTAATATLLASSTFALVMTVEEVVRGNGANT